MPFEQVTVEPGGTTTVVFRGGALSLKLRHPARLSGISAVSRIFFMGMNSFEETMLKWPAARVIGMIRVVKCLCGVRKSS